MLNWGLWLIHVFVSTLFIAGYLTFSSRFWTVILRATSTEKRETAQRFFLGATPLAMMLLLLFAVYHDPINEAMYMNLALFVVAYPLFDNVTGGGFLYRCLVLASFWLIYAHDSLQTVAISLALLIAVCLSTWVWHETVHYAWWASLSIGLVISGGFWALQTAQPVAIAWGGVMAYMLINLFAFIYWSNAHNNFVEQGQLETRANFDALTGLRGYAAFRSSLEEYFQQVRKTGAELTLVMLDIDDFKAINDRYGHMAGNSVLVSVARLLEDTLQVNSGVSRHVYRTGGEEFNVIFPQQTPDAIRSEVEACWQSVRDAHFEYDGKQLHVTISVGVTALQSGDHDIDSLYRRADNNLYQSKRQGRDTITIEGQTMQTSDRRVLMMPYTYFTQPVINTDTGTVVHNELLVRTFSQTAGAWVPARTITMTIEAHIGLVQAALKQLPVRNINLNVARDQYMNERVIRRVTEFARNNSDIDTLTLEVRQLPAPADFVRVAQLYHESGVQILLDGVGSALTDLQVRPVLKAVDALKFDLKAFSAADVWPAAAQWRDIAASSHKRFVLKGVTHAAQVARGRELRVVEMQGPFFSEPVLPEID